jgi:hypothetical protein
MPSFWFSKLQYTFNAIQGQSFKLFFIILSPIGNFPRILLKKGNTWTVGMTAILFPCFINIYPLARGQVVLEDLKSSQMAVDISGLQKLIESSITSFTFGSRSVVPQKNKFMEKGISKLCGGFIEFNDIVKLVGISISNPGTKECANDSKTARNECYFIGTKVQFWTAPFWVVYLDQL